MVSHVHWRVRSRLEEGLYGKCMAAPCVFIAKIFKKNEIKVFCFPKDVLLHQNSSPGKIVFGSSRIIGFADKNCCANGSY